MNVKTDITLTAENVGRNSWTNLQELAWIGTQEQKDIVLAYAKKEIPFWMYEQLVDLANG